MTAVWVVVALLTGYAVGHMRGWVKGRAHGKAEATVTHDCAEVDAQWRQLFAETAEDHRAELAAADRTIFHLRRDNKAEFLAGQQFRTDREGHGLG